MKKILRNILLIILIEIVVLAIIYFVMNRTISVNQQKELKKIYNSNYEDINANFTNLFDNELEEIDKDKLIKILNLLKDEKITPVKFYEYDKIPVGSAYRLIIKSGANQVRVIILNNTINIEERKYWVDEKVIDSIKDILSEYSEHYY